MIIKLQELKDKTNIIIYKNLSNHYDETNFRNFNFEEDLLSKNAQVNSKIYHEVFLLMKFLQTKPQVKNDNINYYDLFLHCFQIQKWKRNCLKLKWKYWKCLFLL